MSLLPFLRSCYCQVFYNIDTDANSWKIVLAFCPLDHFESVVSFYKEKRFVYSSCTTIDTESDLEIGTPLITGWEIIFDQKVVAKTAVDHYCGQGEPPCCNLTAKAVSPDIILSDLCLPVTITGCLRPTVVTVEALATDVTACVCQVLYAKQGFNNWKVIFAFFPKEQHERVKELYQDVNFGPTTDVQFEDDSMLIQLSVDESPGGWVMSTSSLRVGMNQVTRSDVKRYTGQGEPPFCGFSARFRMYYFSSTHDNDLCDLNVSVTLVGAKKPNTIILERKADKLPYRSHSMQHWRASSGAVYADSRYYDFMLRGQQYSQITSSRANPTLSKENPSDYAGKSPQMPQLKDSEPYSVAKPLYTYSRPRTQPSQTLGQYPPVHRRTSWFSSTDSGYSSYYDLESTQQDSLTMIQARDSLLLPRDTKPTNTSSRATDEYALFISRLEARTTEVRKLLANMKGTMREAERTDSESKEEVKSMIVILKLQKKIRHEVEMMLEDTKEHKPSDVESQVDLDSPKLTSVDVSLAASKKTEQQLKAKLANIEQKHKNLASKMNRNEQQLQANLEVAYRKYQDVEQKMLIVEDECEKQHKLLEEHTVSQAESKEAYQDLLEELEQTKRMCRARDMLISSLEKDNEMLVQENMLQQQSPTVMKSLSVTSDEKSVQADYLAVAPGFLRGVDVFGETVLEVVGDKPQKLEWPGYGFYIEIPEGALPPGVTASVAVKVILSGQFQLPENSQLISAIYWVSSSEVFLKEVAVNIQHCAVINSKEQCSSFRFIIAKCSQEVLPYRFREREGVFNPHTQYGAIKLKQFSLIGETASADTETLCTALMFYKQRRASPLVADFHFVVVKDLEPFEQEVERKYQGWCKENYTLQIVFTDSAIKLDQKQENDTWKILPLAPPPQVTKLAVDNFQPGRRIPHCAFMLELLTEKKFQELVHKVDLIGVSDPDSFHIRYPQPDENKVQPVVSPPGSPHSSSKIANPPSDSQPATSSTTADTDGVSPSSSSLQEKVKCEPSNTLDIKNLRQVKKALTNVNDWHSLGLELGLLYPTLERIGKGESINRCKTEMIAAWLKQQDSVSEIGVPSWSVLQTALRNIEENEAANQIATV